jgi:hypothetical protein
MKAEKPPQKKLVKQNIYEPVVKQKKNHLKKEKPKQKTNYCHANGPRPTLPARGRDTFQRSRGR